MAKRAGTPSVPDRAAATSTLETFWQDALNDPTAAADVDVIRLVNSPQTSVRFCVLAQVLGKLISPGLDALCLQRGDGSSGKWDPRGFAEKVVVPWNRRNQNVLGPSNDPYVNNPLRRQRLDDGLDQMRDRDEWERLCKVLRNIQQYNDQSHTEQILRQILLAIRDRLRGQTFTYIVPTRVSLQQAEKLVVDFLAVRSGGDRGLAVAGALFEAFRNGLQIYSKVRRSVINAADAASNSAGDLECVGQDGSVILAVEVKERQLTDADVQATLAKARQAGVREVLFCTEGIRPADQEAVKATFQNAWASGTNLYDVKVLDLMRAGLPLLGEAGIHNFVVQIGSQLDEFSTQPVHRTAWKTLLEAL